ncbi:MAG: alpha/beta hydrolase [Betaproteobacteria bacterium]
MSAPVTGSDCSLVDDSRQFAAPQTRVDIGADRRLNLFISGHGSPTVVLIPGLGVQTGLWVRVQPELSRAVRVLSYDQAGIGFSDPGPLPWTAAQAAVDLRTALRAAHIAPPYLFVAMSMGTFEAREFVRENPGEVVGMVFVDPTPDDFRARAAAVSPNDERRIREQSSHYSFCADCARDGLLGPDRPPEPKCVLPVVPGLSEIMTEALQQNTYRESYWRTLASQFEGLMACKPDGNLGSMPVIVLSAGARQNPGVPSEDFSALEALVTAGHAEMARLSTRGEMRCVPQSGHLIMWDRPDAVIAAIRDVIAAV